MGNNYSYSHTGDLEERNLSSLSVANWLTRAFFVKNVVEFFFLLSRCKAIYTNNGCKLVKTII